MSPKTLQAVYEKGVLRPLQPLDLSENEQVQVTISPIASEGSGVANCYEVAEKAGIIGALREAPADLSTNPEHFQGSARHESRCS